MKDHLFVWMDDDREYIDGVMAFLQQSAYQELIDLKIFTTSSNAELFLKQTSMTPLIIGTERMMQSLILTETQLPIVVLQEQSGDKQQQENKSKVFLYKYQALTRLFAQLCQIDLSRKQALGIVDKHPASRTKVIGVYAAIGHCGKSTVALNIARGLAARQYRVLYLSLESIGTAGFVLQAGKDQEFSGEKLSQLLYFLKMDRSKFLTKLASSINRDSNIGIDYICAIDQIREMAEMSKSDVKLLLDGVVQMDQYDWVIIDSESSIHPRIVSALEYCNDVVWLIQDDAICMHKSELTIKSMPSLNRLHFVVSKYTGRMAVDAGAYGCEPSFFMPYIPEWKNNSNPHALITHRVYQEAISFVIRELEKQVLGKGR
jgi:cellulose biosynthesis protein BcsQ